MGRSIKGLSSSKINNSELIERANARKKYQIQNFEIERSKDYLEHLSFQVNLDRLYVLEDTCKYNKNSCFAPILLRIVDEELLNLESNKNKDGVPYKYLLQIWSNTGVLFFERKMVKRPAQWSMSSKIFLLKEDGASDVIYAVKLRLNKHATLFQIAIPFEKLLETNGLTNKADSIILGYANGNILAAVGQQIFYMDILKQISTDKNLVNDFQNDNVSSQKYEFSLEIKLEDIR